MDKQQETEGFRSGIAAHMKHRDMQHKNQQSIQKSIQPNKPPKKGE
jgi:hypothetical protein